MDTVLLVHLANYPILYRLPYDLIVKRLARNAKFAHRTTNQLSLRKTITFEKNLSSKFTNVILSHIQKTYSLHEGKVLCLAFFTNHLPSIISKVSSSELPVPTDIRPDALLCSPDVSDLGLDLDFFLACPFPFCVL